MTPRVTAVLVLLVLATGLTGCLSSQELKLEERRDVATLELAPGEGLEWKVQATPGDPISFTWNATAPLSFDLHGESLDRTHEESYRLGEASRDDSSFEARFEGLHGWYWENRGDAAVTLEVRVEGTYRLIGEV